MSRTRIWRGQDEIRTRAGDLEAALAATGAEVSARWPAVDIWLQHHPGEQPWAVLIDDEHEYQAVAILSRRRRHGVGFVHSATEPGTRAAVLARGEPAGIRLADAIVGELSRSRGPWTMTLGLLPEPDPVATALRRRLRHAQSVPGPAVPRLIFEPGSDLRSHLSRNTRSAVARARNRLVDAVGAPVEFAWLTARDQADAVLAEVIDLHRRRNRQLREHALLDDPAAAAYFEDMVTRHAEAGRLHLLTARVNGELAAFAVCFRAGATSWVYANLVAPEWTDFSLGTMANAEVVRRFHAEPSTACLDWGAGAQRYKLSGGAQVSGTQVLHAWSSWPGWSRAQIRRLQPAWAST
jgi:hypothetical protein